MYILPILKRNELIGKKDASEFLTTIVQLVW